MWSIDFVISAVIFLLVIVLVIFAWNYTNSQVAEQIEFNEIESTALTVSDSLIRTSGIPADWNQTNVNVIGLAIEDNILNDTKASRFVNLSYADARVLLVGKYNFYFELDHINGTIIVYNGTNMTAGIYPANSAIIVPVERYVLYQNKPARMKFIVWI